MKKNKYYVELANTAYNSHYKRYSSPKDWLEAAERDLSKRLLYEYWELLGKVQGNPYPAASLNSIRIQSAKEAKKLIWC